MEIRAYHEFYLNGAMARLGVLLDYAVNFKHENIDYFFKKFIDMGFAAQFECGNPDVIAGRSGVELYCMIRGDYTFVPVYDAVYRSPEYWVGWALAYYQWYSNRTFKEITSVVKPSTMLQWYPTLHEADIMRFVETMDEQLKVKETNLKRLRERAGLSQAQLAQLSGVSIRSIQLYEQRQNDISKAQLNILEALARTLNCSVFDLIDNNSLYNNWGNNTMYTYNNFYQQTMMGIGNYNVQNVQPHSINQWGYGYMQQFPRQAFTVWNDNQFAVQNDLYLNNWNSYWQDVIKQRIAQEQARQEQMKQIRKFAKEALGEMIHESGNRPAELAYGVYSIITADSLVEAVVKAAEAVGRGV